MLWGAKKGGKKSSTTLQPNNCSHLISLLPGFKTENQFIFPEKGTLIEDYVRHSYFWLALLGDGKPGVFNWDFYWFFQIRCHKLQVTTFSVCLQICHPHPPSAHPLWYTHFQILKLASCFPIWPATRRLQCCCCCCLNGNTVSTTYLSPLTTFLFSFQVVINAVFVSPTSVSFKVHLKKRAEICILLFA